VLSIFFDEVPEFTIWLLGIKPEIKKDGTIDFFNTFMDAQLEDNYVFGFWLASAISAATSTLALLTFVLAVVVSRLKEVIPSIQDLMDTHTSVQEKPLQILSLFAVLGFGLLFWFLFLISKAIW